MWFVDAPSIEAARHGVSPHVTSVVVDEDRPYLDVELLADAHQAAGDGALDEVRQRYRRLRKPFNEPGKSHLLVMCGDLAAPDADAAGTVLADVWRPFLAAPERAEHVFVVPGDCDVAGDAPQGTLADAQVRVPHGTWHQDLVASLVVEPSSVAGSCHLPVAQLFRMTGARRGADLAYVLVIGFDSNSRSYRGLGGGRGEISPDQLDAAEDLVTALTGPEGPARTLPLYVVGVTHHEVLSADDDPALDGSPPSGAMTAAWEFLRRCHRMRMSMVVHGSMRNRDLLDVSATPLVSGRGTVGVPVVPAPAFRPGSRTSGMARLRLDVLKGEAQLAFAYDGRADGEMSRPVQVIRPLVSASRITAGEQRLRLMVQEKVLPSTSVVSSSSAADLPADFATYSDRVWEDSGYVALSPPSGALRPTRETRYTRYHLLLLLRERHGSGYDMLLSNHTPLRLSEFTDWSSVLLPAFQTVRSLLQHLREDVLRSVRDQAEDLEKADQARGFERALEALLEDEDVWTEEIREIATTTTTKVSPTNGRLTTYEYHLVTLLPLVRRLSEQVAGESDVERRAREQLIGWLGQLPALRRSHELDGGPSLPLELLHGSGPGLRWVPPGSEGGDGEVAPARDPLPPRQLPPGSVWFPLPDVDDEGSAWESCPPIMARNADVMRWVDGVLGRLRQPDGTYPDELLLGRAPMTEDRFEVLERFPFEVDGAPDAVHPGGRQAGARSTVEAMARVKLLAGFDLADVVPYSAERIRRVCLSRETVEVGRRHRETIVVRSADGEYLGVLRPVQRFVLTSGLQRARDLHEQVTRTLDDPWGFAHVRKGPGLRPITVTPPIIEQLDPDEQEDDRLPLEFVLCDGNHRVVRNVWLGDPGTSVAAVAVVGRPSQPFYAHPFSAFEWNVTAANQRTSTPDRDSKYLVRAVPDELGEQLAGVPRSEWYRRWFRDLSAGFGYMGGQGGRPA